MNTRTLTKFLLRKYNIDENDITMLNVDLYIFNADDVSNGMKQETAIYKNNNDALRVVIANLSSDEKYYK